MISESAPSMALRLAVRTVKLRSDADKGASTILNTSRRTSHGRKRETGNRTDVFRSARCGARALQREGMDRFGYRQSVQGAAHQQRDRGVERADQGAQGPDRSGAYASWARRLLRAVGPSRLSRSTGA